MNCVLSALLLVMAGLISAKEVKAPKEVSNRKSFCAGAEMTLECTGSGNPLKSYKLTSLTLTLYTASSTERTCLAGEDFSTRADLCTSAGGLTQLLALNTRCLNRKECRFDLPKSDQLYPVCGGRLYAIQLEYNCAELSLPGVPPKSQDKPKVYRRFIYNSRESQTGNSPFGSVEKHNSLKKANDKSMQSRHNGVKSTETHFRSVETNNGFNSVESKNSKDDSRGHGNSHEVRRGGSGRSGRRGGGRVKSYDKNGRAIYSDTGFQLGSGATRTQSAIVFSLLIAFSAALL